MTKHLARCAVVRVSPVSLRACLRVADRPARYDEREVAEQDLRDVESWLSSERCVHVALALDDEWSDVWAELRTSFEIHLVRLPDLALQRPRSDETRADDPSKPSEAVRPPFPHPSDLVWTADLFAHGLLDEWTLPTALSEGLRELDRSLSLVRQTHQSHSSRLEALVRLLPQDRTAALELSRLHERHVALAERSSSDLRRLALELVEAARVVSRTSPMDPSGPPAPT